MLFKNNIIRPFFILSIFLLSSLTTLGCNPRNGLDLQSLDVIHEKSFNTSTGKKLVVKAQSGDVDISTWDKPEVYVKILGNERANEKIKFSFDSSDEGVSIIAEKKDKWNFFSFGGIKLRFEIKIPDKYEAKVSSSGGDIRLKDLTGDVNLRTSGGDVSVHNTTGTLAIVTSGGDIDLKNNVGDIKASTSGGDVSGRNFVGNLDASSSGGDIDLSGQNGKVDVHTSGGEIKLNYTGENKGINLSTSGGDISVRLPSDFNASAKMTTSGGSISCSFKSTNIIKVTSSKFEADLNNGGDPLILKTSGGDITVRPQ